MSDKPISIDGKILQSEQGFPPAHTKAFREVAKKQDCVILTRIPGASCEGLLSEGYAAKNFHIKAKSCDWGAAAGFVCLDPMMNKKGVSNAWYNLTENYKSMTVKYEDKTAGVIPLQISQGRLKWLFGNRKVVGKYSDDENYLTGTGESKDQEIQVNFLFVKDKFVKDKVVKDTWRVYYDARKLYGLTSNKKPDSRESTKSDLFDELKTKNKKISDEEFKSSWEKFWETLVEESDKFKLPETLKEYNHYVPVLAMTNPNLEYDVGIIEGYKNAITGDYDLFAVWPKNHNKDLDKRVAGMNPGIKNDDIAKAEDKNSIGKVVGNISERLYEIAQLLNDKMNENVTQPDGYTVNRVFHSDEAGRPFLEEVDQAVAFTPTGEIFLVSPNQGKASQLSSLIRQYYNQGYTIFANKGWINFLDEDVKKMVTWQEGVELTTANK